MIAEIGLEPIIKGAFCLIGKGDLEAGVTDQVIDQIGRETVESLVLRRIAEGKVAINPGEVSDIAEKPSLKCLNPGLDFLNLYRARLRRLREE